MKPKLAIKLVLSAAFILLIAISLRAQDPWKNLRAIQPAYAALSVLVSLAMVAVSCWKWKVLLQLEASPIPFPRLFRFYLIGYYYTVLLPSNVGGDFMRSYLAGRECGSHSRAAVSVFLERMTGLLLLLALACLTPLLTEGLLRRAAVWVPVAMAFGLLATLLVGMALPAPERWLPRLLGRFLPGFDLESPQGAAARLGARVVRALGKIRTRLLSALNELRKSPSALAKVALLTLAFYLLTWINVWTTFHAFNRPVPLRDIASVMPVVMLIASLPLAPFAGLGLSEGAYLYFFGLLGVANPATLAMALFLRLKLVLLGCAGMVCQIPGVRRPGPP